ncbi:MAG: tetratricopeptide repeat protein, partial [Candidatus Heimdallarchaeota archaeon]|nr:tetratricopeptide repeat protein [Candidatus Heimdallarchaeota archaeon]
MKNTPQESLQQVEMLLKQGEYKNALEILETISSREKLTADDKVTGMLFESRIRTKIGELQKARVIVEEILSLDRKTIDQLKVIDTFILKAEISWRLGNLEEGLQSVQEGEKLLNEGGKKNALTKRKRNLLRNRGIIYWYMGKLDDAAAFLEQSLVISEEKKDKKGIAESLNNLGLIYQSKGEFKCALEYYQQSLTIYEGLEDKESISKLVNNIGITYSSIGDQEQALKYFQKTHKIRQ